MNMVISKTDDAVAHDARDTLVPVVSAACGAVLAMALHQEFPVLGGIAAALAGAAAGMLLQKRSIAVPTTQPVSDYRETRIHALETQLACERTEHEAFKRDAGAREAELQRFLADMEMTHSVLEGQA